MGKPTRGVPRTPVRARSLRTTTGSMPNAPASAAPEAYSRPSRANSRRTRR